MTMWWDSDGGGNDDGDGVSDDNGGRSGGDADHNDENDKSTYIADTGSEICTHLYIYSLLYFSYHLHEKIKDEIETERVNSIEI